MSNALGAISDAMTSIPALSEAALVLLGAVVAVDQVSVAQLQLAHPLIAGTLAGALCGRPLEGALAGALLGLLLAGERPVGGVIPPDSGPAAVVAAATLARARAAAGPGAPVELAGAPLALALLLGLLVADCGRLTEAWTRRRNLDLFRRAEAEATPRAVREAVSRAVGLAALRGALTVALVVPLAGAFQGRLPAGGPHPAVVVALLGGIGLAAGERLLGSRRWRGLVLAGAGATAALLFGGHP
jgi:mannose/fructose/N-acetylgalactosamine-specific phosphotransferase system component IIC